MKLTLENSSKGFLIDDEWMGGLSEDPSFPEQVLAYIVDHRTGEAISSHRFSDKASAIEALNRVQREWRYQSTSGCSGEKCGPERCKKESCKIYSGPGSDDCAHSDSVSN